jgi:hypothetical protein
MGGAAHFCCQRAALNSSGCFNSADIPLTVWRAGSGLQADHSCDGVRGSAWAPILLAMALGKWHCCTFSKFISIKATRPPAGLGTDVYHAYSAARGDCAQHHRPCAHLILPMCICCVPHSHLSPDLPAPLPTRTALCPRPDVRPNLQPLRALPDSRGTDSPGQLR